METLIKTYREVKPLRTLLILVFLGLSRTTDVVVITKDSRKLTVWGTPKMRKWMKKRIIV